MCHVYKHFMGKKIATDIAKMKSIISNTVDWSVFQAWLEWQSASGQGEEASLRKQFAKPQINL